MTACPDRTRAALELFKRCLPLPPEERTRLITDACRDDDRLRGEVQAMLEVDRASTEEDQPGQGLVEVRGTLETLIDSAEAEVSVPTSIGRYSVTRLLGSGGMGLVYEAEQEAPRRRVALKILRPESMTEERRRRFEREVEVLGKLRHPGIAQIYEGGSLALDDGPRPFLAMELVDGDELLQHCERKGLSPEERLLLLARIADAVQHAHERGVIHRDLKPENILVDAEGRPKILDFGVAQMTDSVGVRHTTLTHAGELIGTVAFMSPEQISGDPNAVSFSSDVYSLGVVAFEVLAGRLPIAIEGHSLADAFRLIQTVEPELLGSIEPRLRGDAEVIVAKALDKNPNRRYRNAGEFADDIRRSLRHEPIRARRPTIFYQLRKLARRHVLLFSSVAAIILALTTALVVIGRSRDQQRATAENASRQLHRTAIRAASYAVSLQDVASARAHLDSVPGSARGWEWRHVDRQIGTWIFEYELAAPSVGPAAYVEGGEYVAFAHADGRVSLCAPDDGDLVRVLDSNVELHRISRSHPAGKIVAGTVDGNVIMWDLETGDSNVLPTSGESPVKSVDARADGTIVARADGYIAILGRDLAPSLVEGLNAGVWEPDHVWSPDGTILAALEKVDGRPGYEACVGIWNIEDARRVGLFQWDGVPRSLAFSPGGDLLAIGNRQRDIVLLDPSSMEVVADLLGHVSDVLSLAFSPDGALLVSSSGDGTTRIWDVARQRQVRVLLSGWSSSWVAVDPKGRYFTTCSDEGGARAARLQPAAATVMRGHDSYVYSVDFSPRGDLIVSAGFRYLDRTIRLWSAIDGELAGVLSDVSNDSWAVFTEDGDAVVLRSEESGPVRTLRVPDGRPLDSPPFDGTGPVGAIEHAPGHDWLEHLRGGVGPGRDLAVACVAFAPNDALVASRTDENTIVVRRGLGGEILATLEGTGLNGNPAIAPNGRLIAAPSLDHGVYVWNWRSGETRRLTGHTDLVFAVAFSPDGRRLASGSNDTRILLWDVDTWEVTLELADHDSYIFSLAWSPDGTQLVSGSGDRTVRIWDSVPWAERHRQRLEQRTPR